MNFTQSAAENAPSFTCAVKCFKHISFLIQKDPVFWLKPWEWGTRVLLGFVLELHGNLGVMFLWI